MKEFLVNNFGTILVSAIIALIVFMIIRKMIKDKKNGKSCTCNCSNCSMNCNKKRTD